MKFKRADRKDLHIRLDGDALAFYAAGAREGLVPINPLQRVILVGSVMVETPVLHRLAEAGVAVILLSGKRLQFRGVVTGRAHRNGALRVRQYEKSLGRFALSVARDLVRRKVLCQSHLLSEARERRPEVRFPLTTSMDVLAGVLASIDGSIVDEAVLEDRTRSTESLRSRMNTLRGLEGGASAAYFSAFTKLFPPSLGFGGRNRRPPEDPVNALLSLCYTMVHFEFVREIQTIGLDPVIGFYHLFDYGRESLACDLVEPYRAEVDGFVWRLFRERVFAARDFSATDEKPGCYLKKESRKRFYPLYEEWATAFRNRWREEAQVLARRIMDGQDPLSE